MLETPVVIIESDDWGPGPQQQETALDEIRTLLGRFQDAAGTHPVMTIGVILSIPDGQAMAVTGAYRARYLNEREYRPVLKALQAGASQGVFDLQLHGMAHYWPENLLAALGSEESLKRWLQQESWRTEKLPSWLQSRWMDGRSLPSRPLAREKIREAVQEEVDGFRQYFGFAPKVVVPPTFVWDDNVEKAYAEAGIEVLITPGRRYPGRNGTGALMPPDRNEINGRRLPCGLTTLVRDVYFEPALGHSPTSVLERIAWKCSRREPALLETHRFNFQEGHLPASLEALETLLTETLERFPSTRFLSSYEVATQMAGMSHLSLFSSVETAWRRLRS